ncbi:MAG: hypothetical protein ACRDYW_07520 [Acidimicrobiales bacterium]
MLSAGEPRDAASPSSPPRRELVLAQAWWPSARALVDRTVLGGLALASAPAFIVLAKGGSSFDGALVIAALALGALMAFSVEDPAEETLAASPTTLARRRLLRLSALVLGGALVTTVVLAVASTGADLAIGGLGRRALELAAVSGLAIAGAAAARRRSLPGAVHGGAVVAILVVLLISSLAYRFHDLPALLDNPHHERWLWVAAVGWAAAAWSWRDPAR